MDIWEMLNEYAPYIKGRMIFNIIENLCEAGLEYAQ